MKKQVMIILLSICVSIAMMPAMTFASTTYEQTNNAPEVSQKTEISDDQVVVVFKNNVSDAKIKDTVNEQKDHLKQIEDTEGNTAVVDINKDTTVNETVKEYESLPEVDYAQPDYIYTVLEDTADTKSTTNDSSTSNQWYLNTTEVKQAWSVAESKKKSKIRVAVIDTGVNTSHKDLQEALNKTLSYDAVNDTKLTKDISGHGTHVAGIIAATSNNSIGIAGVASGTKNDLIDLVAINAFQSLGNSVGAFSSKLAKSIKYAVDNGAKVINMSLGMYVSDQILQDAVAYAQNNGVVVVCAAGNADTTNPMYPSDYNSTISVIATDKNNNKSSFSDYGNSKTLSAPGSSIYSTLSNGSYGNMSGSSMAAPIVAGTAAMILAVNPSLTPTSIKSILCTTATDINTKGTDSLTGAGNLNANAAVRKAAGLTYSKQSKVIKSTIKVKKPGKVSRVKANKVTKKSARVTWKKTKGTSGYVVYVAKKGHSYKRVAVVSASKAKCIIKKLSKGKQYKIKVKAFKKYKSKKIYGISSKATTCKL